MNDFKILNKYGLLDSATVKTPVGDVDVGDVVQQRMWETKGGKVDENLWGFFLNVDVIGQKDGKTSRIVMNACHPSSWKDRSTAKMTGISASVGAILLARNGGNECGILDPENYFDPEEFLKELSLRNEIVVVEQKQF